MFFASRVRAFAMSGYCMLYSINPWCDGGYMFAFAAPETLAIARVQESSHCQIELR